MIWSICFSMQEKCTTVDIAISQIQNFIMVIKDICRYKYTRMRNIHITLEFERVPWHTLCTSIAQKMYKTHHIIQAVILPFAVGENGAPSVTGHILSAGFSR